MEKAGTEAMRALGSNTAKPDSSSCLRLTLKKLLCRLSLVFLDGISPRLDVDRHEFVRFRLHVHVRPDALLKDRVPPPGKFVIG